MKVLNRRDPEVHIGGGNVYVGRPSPWGNPWRAGHDLSRREAVANFRTYAEHRVKREPGWLEPLRAAEALVCWCAPMECHADVLAELLDATAQTF